MSLGACIPDLIEQGKIPKGKAAAAQRLYDERLNVYDQVMGDAAAKAAASGDVLKALEIQAAIKERQVLLQAKGQRDAWGDVLKHESGSPYAGIKGLMANDPAAPYANATRSAQRIEQQAHAELREFMQRHRRDFLGSMKDRAGGQDVARELHGQATDNPRAATFAKAIGQVFETLRQRFNSAGGNIGKLAGWGLPHRWSALKVRNAGFERFRDVMLRELDRARMIDRGTGAPMSAPALEKALADSFEAIRTNGLAGDDALSGGGRGSLANSRSDHRFFIFKDADAWQRVHQQFGDGDVFNVVMDHIRGMATDIALIERFGPNPEATVKWLLKKADQADAVSAKANPRALTGSSGGRASTEKLWDFINGRLGIPAIHDGPVLGTVHQTLTQGLAGTRNLLTAALLGSSPLSAISDLNTQIMARALNGLPETKLLAGYLNQLNPLDATHRKRAQRLGLGARDASRSLLGMQRYFGETSGPGWTQVIADDVLRLSGLNKWTEAGQRAFGLDYLAELADERALGFDNLPATRKLAFARHGIDADMWDRIRMAETLSENGAEWMDFRKIAEKDPDGADRMMDLVLAETAAAVQEASPVEQSMMTFGRPGTLAGEAGRTSLQFKSFAFGLLMAQARRIAYVGRHLGPSKAALYAASFFAGMTLFGALAMQLREIAKGRDPRPMDNWEFWADAALQGGGIGIFGDLIGSFFNDRIDSIYQFVGGPMVGLAQDIKRFVAAENKGAQASRLMQRYVPGSSLWYARLAYERLVIDELRERIDPDYRKSWRRMQKRAEKQGQEFYWAPGETAPDRLPDFSNMYEGAEQ